jgi:hypothetical protein
VASNIRRGQRRLNSSIADFRIENPRGKIMSIRSVLSILAIVPAMFGLCAVAGEPSETAGSAKAFNRISSIFQSEADALGKRLAAKGRERIVYTGEFSDAAGHSTTARVIIQLPRMARLEGFADKVLAFDGEQMKNATSRMDRILLESFLVDTQEGMLASIQGAASARLLGRDFGPDPGINSKKAEPRYDIYDVMMPDLFRKDAPWQSRLYSFDSKTRLLQNTQYYDRAVSPPIRIETRFSMWGTIDGSAYPACIERYEDGKLVFSFIATSIESGPAQDLGTYR